MPKIIENVPEKLVETARRQIMEKGFLGLNMRSVAKECGIGLGTVYNYFPSKENLLAAFVADDWNRIMKKALAPDRGKPLKKVLQDEYEGIKSFYGLYSGIFSDPEAKKVYNSVSSERHARLRAQLAEPIEASLRDQNMTYPPLLPVFLAENLLTWSLAGTDFGSLYEILSPLLCDCKDGGKRE